MSVKIKRLAYKLQTALCQKGRYIRINQLQAYSPKSERMVTKYVLTEKRTTLNGKKKSFTILETYQMADVVKTLAEMYGEVNGTDS